MADFETALPKTGRFEGLYSDDPDDQGKETFLGVSRYHHPGLTLWRLVDASKGKPGFPHNIPKEAHDQAREFYRREFWNMIRGDDISSQAVADEIFDTAVNIRPSVAVGFLQRTLNATNRNGLDYPDVVRDEAFGPKTMAALEAHLQKRGEENLLAGLNHLQGHYYFVRAEKREKNEKYMNGWLKRTLLNRVT